jgi:hypothetical protein
MIKRTACRARRRGVASLEAVMVTAVAFPMVVTLLILGIRALRGLFWAIGAGVGWPML